MSENAGRLASLDTSVGRGNSLRQFGSAGAATDVDDGNDINGTTTTTTLLNAGNIHFLQLNLQHSKTASAVLQRQIAALEHAVILVQEPWTVNNNVAGLRTQHVSIYCGTSVEKPQTCVLVKGLSAYLQQFGSRDVTVVCITYHCNGKKNTILVASVYMPIDSRLRFTVNSYPKSTRTQVKSYLVPTIAFLKKNIDYFT